MWKWSTWHHNHELMDAYDKRRQGEGEVRYELLLLLFIFLNISHSPVSWSQVMITTIQYFDSVTEALNVNIGTLFLSSACILKIYLPTSSYCKGQDPIPQSVWANDDCYYYTSSDVIKFVWSGSRSGVAVRRWWRPGRTLQRNVSFVTHNTGIREPEN